MVWNATISDKEVASRFAETPWTKEAEDWIRIDERLPEDHLARRIDRAIDLLALAPLVDSYLGVGRKAYRPDLLLKLILYESQAKRPSPSQWARDVKENEPLRWLVLGIEPSRSQLYAFRDRIGPYLDAWNAQVLQMAIDLELTDVTRAALDGSTIAANASRKKLANEELLAKRIQELDDAIRSTATGQSVEQSPAWMATSPQSAAQQREHYRHVQRCLRERHRENDQRRSSKRKPRDKVLVSLTDPETALGPDKDKVYRPLYNIQFLRDLDSPLILGYDVFAQVNDSGTLPILVERTVHLIGHKPETLLADAGYVSLRDLFFCEDHGITLYAPFQENDQSKARQKKKSCNQFTQLPKTEFTWLENQQTFQCPAGHRLRFSCRKKEQRFDHQVALRLYVCPAEYCLACPRQAECTRNPEKGRMVSRMEHEELLDQLVARMQTEEAKTLYRLRKQTVELSFADMKEHRGLRRLSCRGRRRAKNQVACTVLAHNLLTVHDARDEGQSKPTARLPMRSEDTIPRIPCLA